MNTLNGINRYTPVNVVKTQKQKSKVPVSFAGDRFSLTRKPAPLIEVSERRFKPEKVLMNLGKALRKHPVLTTVLGLIAATTSFQISNYAQFIPDQPQSKIVKPSHQFDYYSYLRNTIINRGGDFKHAQTKQLLTRYMYYKHKISTIEDKEDIVDYLKEIGYSLIVSKKATKLTDVDIYQVMLFELAELSGENKDLFAEYLNRVFVGNSIKPLYAGNFGVKKYDNSPLVIGDEGYYEKYRDYTYYQSRHLSGFIISGYRCSNEWARFGNFIHEFFQRNGNRNDFYAGQLGIKIGHMLACDKITPLELAQNIGQYVGTEALFEDNWLRGTSMLNESRKPSVNFR